MAAVEAPQPTIREACLEVEASYRRHQTPAWRAARARIFAAAIDEGVTYRELGAALGLSPTRLHKIAGAQTGAKPPILDRPFRRAA